MALQQRFTMPTWVRGATAFAAVAFALLGVGLYQWQGASLLSLAPLGLSLACGAVLLQSLRAQVAIYSDRLLVVARYFPQSIARQDIVQIDQEEGLPVCLRLQSGKRLYLPEVGSSNAELATFLRDWLQRSEASEQA
jgi:hypothetical protein